MKALLILLVASCLPMALAHDYVVTVSDDGQRLAVRAELASPARIEVATSRGARQLRQIRRCDSDESLSVRRGRVRTPEHCVSYSVELSNSASSARVRARYASVRDIVMSPHLWLLLPDDDRTRIRVSFVLPPGINVSVPWDPVPARSRDALSVAVPDTSRIESYEFYNRQISSNAVSVIGRFEHDTIAVPGGELRVAFLRTRHPPATAKLKRWLSDAARNVSRSHGKFPMRSTQVVVVPVNDRAAEPVPFGHVIRNGGEAVQFFVDTAWNLDAFLGDWTATHEFSHLLMPYVRDRWVSEGFASYYQNVLMARGGVYTPEMAWRKLHEGFGRGRLSAPGLSPRSASMRNGGLMKMYWSGAALALIGDVRLRELTNGEQTLDELMRHMRLCCLPSRKAYSDREFFTLLDSKTEHTVFTDLYRTYANAAGFPDVGAVFTRLGIRTGARLELVDAELSAMRDAMMESVEANDR
ncbi:MAG: hypothetical protein AAF465_05525 [Pseudomonadota bacterium]